jgi:hypothetical protein
MITANASTAADDLGVATSGVAASIEGTLEKEAPSSAVPHVISPTGIPGDAAEQPHDDLSRALFNNDTSDNIQANTCDQPFKSLPLTLFISMCPLQMAQRFGISKFMRDRRSTGSSPHQVL